MFSGTICCVPESHRARPTTGRAAAADVLAAELAKAYGRMLRVVVPAPPPPPIDPPGSAVNLMIDSPAPVPLPRFVAVNTRVPFSDRVRLANVRVVVWAAALAPRTL